MSSIFSKLFGSPELSPPSKQVGDEGARELAAMQSALSPQEREGVRSTTGKRLLAHGKGWSNVNWRQFGLMHNAVHIRHTKSEGGDFNTSLEAWSSLLKQMEKDPALTFSKYFTGLPEALADVKTFDDLLPKGRDAPLGDDALEMLADQNHALLKQRLGSKGYAFAPWGYRHGSTNPAGHRAPLKFTKRNGGVEICILNTGDGALSHPTLGITEAQEKISYRSFAWFIRDEDFYGPNGHALLCHLLRFMTDPPLAGASPYLGSDIYDFLSTIGTLLPVIELERCNELESKWQRSGNCAEKAIKYLIRDFLVMQGVPILEIRKFFCNARFLSLIAGYNTFTRAPTDETQREHLRFAAEKYQRDLLKLKPHLDEKAFLEGSAVAHEILNSIDAITKVDASPISKPGTPKSPSELQSGTPAPVTLEVADAKPFPQIELPPLEIPDRDNDSKELKKRASTWTPPLFDAKRPLESVTGWIDTLKLLDRERKSLFLYECVMQLPVPLFEADDVWSALPEETIRKLLPQLRKLLVRGKGHEPVGLRMGQNFTICFTLYAVADKLARLLPETRLDGFASPFPLLEYPFQPNTFTSIPNGSMNKRYVEIETYFAKCKEASHGKVIFPVAKILPIESYYEAMKRGDTDSQGVCHILYLQQFLPPRSANLPQLQLYFDIWTKTRPEAIDTLYFFAVMGHLVFSSRPMSSLETDAYTFQEELDKNKRALRLGFRYLSQFIHYDLEKTAHLKKGLWCLDLFSLGVSLGYYEKFFFKKSRRELTTNDAALAKLSENGQKKHGLPPAVYRDLLRISRKKALGVAQAQQWLSEHVLYVDIPQVQLMLDHCFFTPGVLTTILEEEPNYIETLREVIRDSINRFRLKPSHLDALCFLIRTGIHFETFAQERSNPTLAFYIDALKKLSAGLKRPEQQTMVQTHLLYAYSVKELTDEERVDYFIQHFLPPSVYLGCTSSFNQLVRDMEYLRSAATIALAKDPKSHRQLCTKIVTHFLKKSPEGAWEGTFPTFTCGAVTIDFSTFKISHKSYGEMVFDQHATTQFLPNEQNEPGIVTSDTVTWRHSNGTERSPVNENTRTTYVDNRRMTERQMQIDGKEFWAREFELDPSLRQNPAFMALERLGCPLSYYRPLEKGHTDLICIDRQSCRPLFRIAIQLKSTSIYQLDEKGNTLPRQLIDLGSAKQGKEGWIAHLGLQPEEMTCYIDTKTGQIDELSLPPLHLHFKKSARGLESVEHPGFVLVNEKVEALNSYPGALVLQKGEKKKVVLAARGLQSGRGDFSREVFPTTVEISLKRITPYYLYDVDPLDGTLKGKEAEDYLYLVLILKMQRDYEKAAFYLRRMPSKSFTTDDPCFMQLTALDDATPGSLAFNAFLLYTVIDHGNQLTEERLTQGSSSSHRMLSWYQEAYIDYLRAIHNDTLSAIPAVLRLKPEQEMTILRAIYRTHMQANTNPPPLILFRLQLFAANASEKTVKATIEKKELSLRPASYGKITKPSALPLFQDIYRLQKHGVGSSAVNMAPKEDLGLLPRFPVRLTSKALRINFPTLFEQAKAAKAFPDPFDLTLTALLSTSDSIDKALVELLFYVRHFPKAFAKIDFAKVTTAAESIIVLDHISDNASQLENDPNYHSFRESVIEPKGLFDYTREVTRPVPQKPESVPLAPLKPAVYEKTPLRSLCDGLFKRNIEKRELPETPPFYDAKLFEKSSPIEKEAAEKFLKGYQKLQDKTTTTYTLKKEGLTSAKKQLNAAKTRAQQKISELEEAISIVNSPYRMKNGTLTREEVLGEIDLTTRREGGQTIRITPEIIMQKVILTNNTSFLRKACPMLSEGEITAVIDRVILYYHTVVQLQQAQEALDLVATLESDSSNTDAQTKLAEILDYEYHYDPMQFPEISYFKVKTGKLPRPDQVYVYLWVCEGLAKGENRLFQLPAGGGKTTYLEPLLCLRAKRMGLVPTIFTTSAIYAVDKNNLRSTLEDLGERLSVLELGLHMKLGAADFKVIYLELEQYRIEGRTLLLTPQIYYSLKLMYEYAAIKENDVEKVKWLSKILNFFKIHSLQILDESHRNLDALTKAIYGVGELFTLPKGEHALFLELMKPLLGLTEVKCEDGTLVHNVARLSENFLGTPTSDEIKKIQRGMAKHMAASSMLGIPKKDRESFIHYWTSKGAPQPPLLKEWATSQKSKADLASLVGYFNLVLLPHLTTLRTGLDHGRSLFPEEEFHVPYHHKTPSTAQFADVYLTLLATIKGLHHIGLSENQVQRMVEKLINADWKELSEVSPGYETPSAERFQQWVGKNGIHLRDIALNEKEQMQEVHHLLSKNPSAVEYYLAIVILAQIGYSQEQLAASPVHIMNGFKHSVLFSATPLTALAYPRALNATLLDPLFEAEVVTTWSLAHNQTYVRPESTQDFLSDYAGKSRVWIDLGGFFCDLSNKEVAKRWLERDASLDGVLYFKQTEGKKVHVDREEIICLLTRSGKVYEIEGSDIKEALKKHDLKFEGLRLATFYDSGHIESTNIYQPPQVSPHLFLGDKVTTSQSIQGPMRVRSLLKQNANQCITWVVQEKLAAKIGTLNAPSLFAWCVRNEAEEIKKRIILAAYEEISFQIEQLIYNELALYKDDPEMQMKILQKYRGGLLETAKHDPYALFAEHERDADAVEVLLAFAKKHYARFGFGIALVDTPFLFTAIKKVAIETQMVVGTISTHVNSRITQEVEQQCQLKRQSEQEKLQHRPRPFDPRSVDGIYGSLEVTDPDYPSKADWTSAQHLFGKEFSPRLFIEKNQLHTAVEGGKPLMEKCLKPIDLLEIVILGDSWKAVAISNEILETNLKQARECPAKAKLYHQVFYISSDGKFYARGQGALRPSDMQIKAILASPKLKDIVIDAGLLRGKVYHPTRLQERLTNWPTFPALWNRILEALPNPETADQNTVSRFIEELKV